jgi:AcrR family transcriptional regulator
VSRSTPLTFRERRHASAVSEIKEVALRHYAEGGEALSLRAVAREMGMSAQALYHYFASRDDLLTALIADGYHSAAARVAAAREAAGPDRRSRMIGAAHGYREWAVERPHEFRLVYGDTVRGYAAPAGGPTDRLGMRVGEEFARACFADWTARDFGELAGRLGGPPDRVAEDPPGWDAIPVVVRVHLAEWWGQLHGLVALEIQGHLGWTGAEPAAVFTSTARRLADRIGRVIDPG